MRERVAGAGLGLGKLAAAALLRGWGCNISKAAIGSFNEVPFLEQPLVHPSLPT